MDNVGHTKKWVRVNEQYIKQILVLLFLARARLVWIFGVNVYDREQESSNIGNTDRYYVLRPGDMA